MNESHTILKTKPFFFALTVLFLALGWQAYAMWRHTPTLEELRKEPDIIYGIDISRHQKTIDWTKVREWEGHPVRFVYIKATEGTTI